MPITVKHLKVSTIADADDTSLVRPSDWNADHALTGTIPVENGGTNASTAAGGLNNLLPSQAGNNGKVLATDGTNATWTSNGSGDVVGPASATDNAVARFDATTGKLIQNSVVIVSDTGVVTGVTELTASTKVVSPSFDALNSAGGQLRNSSGTSQLQWGGGGGNNVSVDVAININPANAQVAISPTGTGSVTINPATAGTMNNMVIGGTTPLAGSFTNLSVTGTTSFDGAQGTAGQVLTSAGSGNTPTWSTTAGVNQSDVGTAPNQIPLNQYLGTIAYQDNVSVNIIGGFVSTKLAPIQPTPTALTASATLTTAQIQTQIIQVTSATAVTLTMPTGTVIDGAIVPVIPIDSAIDFSIINTGSALGAVTVAVATGVTNIGGLTVAISDSGIFRLRRTATNTYILYRLA
jgi:hypothetical protein